MAVAALNLGSLEDLERELARRRLEEAKERAPDVALQARIAAMMDELHPEARAIADDRSPLVAVLGTRRSGKSRTSGRGMIRDALEIPDARIFYTNETWRECDRIIWTGNGRDGLLTLNKRFDLGGIPNMSNHTLSFPSSGGIIEIVPADDAGAVDRLRGSAPHKLVADEVQKMRHIEALVQDAAGAAMMDAAMITGREAQIIIQGTPSEDLAGLFYDVTGPDSQMTGWSKHTLNVLSNPFFGETPEERFKNTVEKYCRIHNLPLDHPKVRREWFAEWVREDARYVYAVHQVPEHKLCYAEPRWLEAPVWRKDGQGRPLFLEGGVVDFKAALADLPPGPDWEFTLFADLGYLPDPFAYVLWAWSWEWDELLEVASWARCEMDSDDQLAHLMMVQQHVPAALVGGDIGGANKPTGKGWSKRWSERFGGEMREAEKHKKYEHIQLFNTDLRKERIRVRRGSPLHEQLKRVRWLPPTGTGPQKEDPAIPNDITDGGLYGHRHTYQHLAQRQLPAPKVGTAEYYAKLEAELEAQDMEEPEQESYYDG